jgi:uncharacterized membrane protein YczE
MKSYIFRLARLLLGLMLYGPGVVLTLKANIGYAPWDVFHAGTANITGLTIGMASILVGFVILTLAVILGEKIGIGSILNMFLIGSFIDLILYMDLIPLSNNIITGILMVIAGLFTISLATYFYMSSSFGAGPRDSLMVALKRKTGLPIGFCRSFLEFMAAIIGWRMGGLLGFGTIMAAVLAGFCIQFTFKLVRFDSTAIKHETLMDTYRNMTNRQKTSSNKTAQK